jgi:hypothetical protein
MERRSGRVYNGPVTFRTLIHVRINGGVNKHTQKKMWQYRRTVNFLLQNISFVELSFDN